MSKRIKLILYIIGLIICFIIGTKIWKISRTKDMVYYHKKVDGSVTNSSVLAYVGTVPIRRSDLDAYYKIQIKDYDKDLTGDLSDNTGKIEAPLKEALFEQLIEQELLYQMVQMDESFKLQNQDKICENEWKNYSEFYGKDSGISGNMEQKLKQRLCERVIINTYLDKVYYSSIEISDEELKQYYEKNKDKYTVPDKVLVRQIVLVSEADAIKVQNGLTRANFEQRVKEYSISLDKEQGGLVGPFARGQMPHFFDVAFMMKKGQIQGVIKSDYGFHLFLLEDKFPKKVLTFNEAKKKVQEDVLNIRKEEMYKKWVQLALSSIKVEVQRVSL